MRETVAAKLELIAALAKDAAIKVRSGKYWEGELARDLARIREALQEASQEQT